MSEAADAEVQSLRDARGSAAELKARLVALRAEMPAGLVFVFEGDDDRSIYLSWIRQIDAEIRYEPFSCGGKTGVLRLWEAVKRDVNGLAEEVYFFVDRDFDDLRGADADSSIYMTDSYSVESYLVNSGVLDNVLKIEFHCHGSPGIRGRVVELFEKVYEEFLSVAARYNLDLYISRQASIELIKPLPKTVTKLARVDLEAVGDSGVCVEEVVVTTPKVTETQRAQFQINFDSLDRRSRHRGKFALAFFRAWLEKLAEERRREASSCFCGLKSDVKISTERLTLATLAARADPPRELAEFITGIAR